MKASPCIQRPAIRAHHVIAASSPTLLCAVVLAVFLQSSIAADGPVSAVQDALKREKFYFGESTGELDDGTRAALRRFQIRQGLPPTGEIDTATVEKLQASTPAASPPAVVTAPPASKPIEAIAEKDRQFLQRVESGLEPQSPKAEVAPPEASQASAPTVPPSASAPLKSGNATTPVVDEPDPKPPKPTASKSQRSEKSGRATIRKMERIEAAEPEPIASGPQPRVEIRARPRGVAIVESDNDPDVLGSHGTRIIRSPNSARLGERVYIYEKRTVTTSSTPIPVRRAEPVDRRKHEGFFDRLFKGGDDDDDRD